MALTETKVPDATYADEVEILCLISLTPLKLPPPLKPPILSPTATYSFIEARAAALKITTVVQPLLQWIKGFLLDATPGIASLVALNLEDRLISGRSNTLKDIIPKALPQPQTWTAYVIQAAPRAPSLQAPIKKAVTPA